MEGSRYAVPHAEAPSNEVFKEPEPLTLRDATHRPDGSVWNFAFGANLSRKILTGRRKIEPLESWPALANGWELSFDYRGIPFLEPGFGTLRKTSSPSVCVHGVVHRMSAADYQQLLVTEGGSGRTDVPGYRSVPIRCTVYAPSAGSKHPPSMCENPAAMPGVEIVAVALIATSDVLRLGTLPSNRYVDLLISGSKNYGLADEYQNYLSSHPRHRKTRAGWATICFLYLIVFLPIWILLLPFWCCCGGQQRKMAKVRDTKTGTFAVVRQGKPPARCFHVIGECIGKITWGLNSVCLPWCKGAIEYPNPAVRSPQDLATKWPQFKEATWALTGDDRHADKPMSSEAPMPVAAFRV